MANFFSKPEKKDQTKVTDKKKDPTKSTEKKDQAKETDKKDQTKPNENNVMQLWTSTLEDHKNQMSSLISQIENSRQDSMRIMMEIKKEKKDLIDKYEKEKIEKKKKKKEKQKKANEQLINDTKESKELTLKECEEDFDEMENIFCMEDFDKLDFSEILEDLFNNLYAENIKNIFLQIILEQIKSFQFNNKINCYNIQIIGNSGVGKSTLINSLLRQEIAKTSIGSVGTLETKEYTSERFPFIKFIDTRGTELDSANDINKVRENTLNYIETKLSEKDPNKTIHCLFYCLTGNRFEGIVKEVLIELRKKYKNGNLPIIIVYTQKSDDNVYNEMKNYIQKALKDDSLTEISDKVEDINIVGVIAKKIDIFINGQKITSIKPFGLDILLNFLKLKAKHAFIIATVNMIKKFCFDFARLLLENTLTIILRDINDFISKENDLNNILFNTLKNLFIKYIPQENFELTEDGENNIKNSVKIFEEKIKIIQKNNLEKFISEASENIGNKMDKAQYNVIYQNNGVVIHNLKEHDQYKKEGKDELEQRLIKKSELYAKKNFTKKLYEKAALKFKMLFKEKIETIIENENEINDLIKELNNQVSEEITDKIDNLIEEIKIYQNGDID